MSGIGRKSDASKVAPKNPSKNRPPMKKPYLMVKPVGEGKHARAIVTVRHPYNPSAGAEQLDGIFAACRRLAGKSLPDTNLAGVTWAFGGFVYTKEAGWRPTPPARPIFSASVRLPEIALAEAKERASATELTTFVDFGADTKSLPSLVKADNTDPSDPDAIIPLYVDFSFRSVEGFELPRKLRSKSERARMDLRAGETDIAKIAEKHGLKESTIKKLRNAIAKELSPAGAIPIPPKLKPAELPPDKASKSEQIRRAMAAEVKRGLGIDAKFFADAWGIPQPMARRLKQEALRRAKGS